MIRAIIKDGLIHPFDPLPAGWTEGKEIEISGEVLPPEDLEELEKRWAEIEAIIAQTPEDPEDDKRLEEAILEQRRVSKEQVRRQMGLS